MTLSCPMQGLSHSPTYFQYYSDVQKRATPVKGSSQYSSNDTPVSNPSRAYFPYLNGKMPYQVLILLHAAPNRDYHTCFTYTPSPGLPF